MTEGEFPFRSFTMRSEGYDRSEVDSYVDELRSEIVEIRRALDTATASRADGEGDARLHDPEGAVTRTLAIAQETADRVLHDAQVEADRRRSESEEHASVVMADADERAARLLADMETQAAEVREQGIAAARSAIQVERDKAMAELAHMRRVRDDLRTEAVDLKAALDRYRSQAREASDSLSAAATGPLMSLDLPDFIDDDVVLAGIVEDDEVDEYDIDEYDDFAPDDDPVAPDTAMIDDDPSDVAEAADGVDSDSSHLHSVDYDSAESDADDQAMPMFADDLAEAAADGAADEYQQPALADVISIDSSDDGDEDDDSGAFLAEVRAAAEDDVTLPPENDGSDRFLSELRGLADADDGDIDGDAADTFFDD